MEVWNICLIYGYKKKHNGQIINISQPNKGLEVEKISDKKEKEEPNLSSREDKIRSRQSKKDELRAFLKEQEREE